MSLEDKLRNIITSNPDNDDTANEIEEISRLLGGNFNHWIPPRFLNIISIVFYRYPVKKKEIKLAIECIKRGANPEYLFGSILNYLNDYENLKIIFANGYDPNTTVSYLPTMNHDCDYPLLKSVKFINIVYLFLLYGATPSSVFKKRDELMKLRTKRISEGDPFARVCYDFSISHVVMQSAKMEPIVKTMQSFLLATCVDDIHFKETMMESLWPHLKYHLFCEFY